MPPNREPLATRKNASLTLAAFLVICTAWWYAQQPGSPTPPPTPGDTTVVVDPVDTVTPPLPCNLAGGSGIIGSATCQPCQYTPPGPTTASSSASCVEPAPTVCNLIDGSGDIGSATCQVCPYNPPGASYATTSSSCVPPPVPVPCNLFYGSGVVGSTTCQPCPYNPPGQSFASQAPTCQPPTTPPDTTPTPDKDGPAFIAELPRAEPSLVYPTNLTNQIVVPSGGNLQTAINSATPGTEILLEPGAIYTGNFNLPAKGGNSWIVIRTNTSMVPLTTRMTSTLAASKGLATIRTNNSSPAIGTSAGASYYWFDHVKILADAGFSGGNVLFRIGDAPSNGHTTIAQTPHHISIVRSWVTAGTSVNIRRNVLAHGRQLIIASSTLDQCHDPGGDSQCILGYNATKELLIQNNTLMGAHEIVMFGGADPADSTMVPQDVTMRGNYIFRPASWKGVWPVKNFLEAKDVLRWLIENNVIENGWADAQSFGFNFKSENQQCSANYTQSADITMRYNRIRNVGDGFNFSGNQGACTSRTAARFTIRDNWIESGFNVAPFSAEGIVSQVLNGMTDLIFAHNTIRNSGASLNMMKLAGNPMVRMSIHSNAFYKGDYGVKGDGQAEGVNSINTYAPSGLWSHNIMIGATCANYPANNICPSSWPTVSSPGYDQRAIGADTVNIKIKTAGVMVVATVPDPPGIDIFPGQSIQSMVNAHPAGTTFILKAGTHTQQSVIPKANMTFRGETGTILDGLNSTQFAFRAWNGVAWVDGVKLVNFTITKYSPPPQNGAVWIGNDQLASGSGWIIDSMEISHNSNLGVRIGNRAQILRTNFHHNTTINLGGVARAVLVDGISSTYGNNGCVNNPGFESGGSKFVGTDSLIVRNSTFSDNCGVGLWLDINNRDYLLHNNVVERNYREGIAVEVSFRGKVYNNTANANGWPVDIFRPNGWLWDAGIGIHATDSVEVYNNILTENFNGIVIIQQPRCQTCNPPEPYAPPSGYISRDVYVHDNTVYCRTFGGPTGGDGSVCAGAATDVPSGDALFLSRNNRFEANTYYSGTNTYAWAWMNAYRNYAAWTGYGHDTPVGSNNP